MTNIVFLGSLFMGKNFLVEAWVKLRLKCNIPHSPVSTAICLSDSIHSSDHISVHLWESWRYSTWHLATVQILIGERQSKSQFSPKRYPIPDSVNEFYMKSPLRVSVMLYAINMLFLTCCSWLHLSLSVFTFHKKAEVQLQPPSPQSRLVNNHHGL